MRAESRTFGGQTYYVYELFTPTALAGAHNMAAVTFKGNLSLLMVASASEKQWGNAEKPLRQARAERGRFGRRGAGLTATPARLESLSQ